ncbi:MAG: HD domain-containing protein [Gemmataceae bacterium]|nr:HD domain-containing protein [Gemmataceae bacterium]
MSKKAPATTYVTTQDGVPEAVLLPGSDDPVVRAIERVREEYAVHLAEVQDLRIEVRELRSELAQADEIRASLQKELELAKARTERLQRKAETQRERADRLADLLRSIHHSLFQGNVFDLILKACLQITGATRGVYVTAWTDRFRIRAAVDLDGVPQAPISHYLEALCNRVLASNDTLIAKEPRERTDLPKPTPAETFRNMVVAPVTLMKDLNGIIVLADKAGDFDADDAESVLSVGDQAAVAIQNQRLQHDLINAYFSIVGVLADAVETKDSCTHGHCEMVDTLSRQTAQAMGLEPLACTIAFYGGLLHDVGKIGVSDGILNKPARLTPEEWVVMRSHVRMGYDLLKRVPFLGQVAEIVLHHHERFDGEGYPDRLLASQIPLTARIVCAVDAYCAMIAKRSYKESMSPIDAQEELLRCKGTHFDPEVVDGLLSVLETPVNAQFAEWEPPLGVAHPADFRQLVSEYANAPRRV